MLLGVVASDGPFQAMGSAEHPNFVGFRVVFDAATMMELGNGTTTLFWSDRWFHGKDGNV